MNLKIPLYHSYIEFANSVDKAQSPLYFAELYWTELSQLHDMVQFCAVHNMTNTNIIRFVMSAMINMRWIAKYWQKLWSLVRPDPGPDTHLTELCRRFKKLRALRMLLRWPVFNKTIVVTW